MIERTKELSCFFKNRLIADLKKQNITAVDDIVDFLIYSPDYNMYTYKRVDVLSMRARIARLLFLPIFYLLIAPAQWLFFGSIGLDKSTKIGAILLNVLTEKKGGYYENLRP